MIARPGPFLPISALGGEVDRFRRGAGGVEQIESLAPNIDVQ